MKKLLFVLATVCVTAFVFSSCTASKRDCRGVKHYRQPGGFYM